MASRDRYAMDDGLRITVGNDVFYQHSKDSPSGDLRNRLVPHPNMGLRMDKESHPERNYQSKRQWEDKYKQNYSPERLPPYDRQMGGDYYFKEKPKERLSPPSGKKQRFPEDSSYMYYQQESPGRRYSQSPQRGRSPPRRGSPYRYGGAHSPRMTQHRSSPPRDRSRYRSSSDSSDSECRQNSKSFQKREPPPDDFLMTMYSGSGNPQDGSREKRYSSMERGQKSGKKPHVPGGTDDEDRFLYGDGSSGKQEHGKKSILKKRNKSPENIPDPNSVQNTVNVTPGGFDNKALKNVLKAIGFDFELSKQSIEKAVKDQTPEKKSNEKSSEKEEDTNKPVSTPVTVAGFPQVNTNMTMPYQLQGAQYISPQMLTGQAAGGVYIYQPQASGPPQLVYQPTPIASNTPILQKPTNVSKQQEKSEKKAEAKAASEERRARKQRLKFLELELAKLKQQQLELVKKRTKQISAGDQELLRQNSLLQVKLEKQIKDIHVATGKKVVAESSSESSESEESDSSEDELPEVQYYDPGDHACRICNDQSENLLEFLQHLHFKTHKKEMDPSDKPWMKKILQKNKKKKPNMLRAKLKGAEFLMPVLSFYCKICKEHFTDELRAEDHCYGGLHNEKYKKFCLDHPKYDKSFDPEPEVKKIRKYKEEMMYKDPIHVSGHQSPLVRMKEEQHPPPPIQLPPKRSYQEPTPPKRYESPYRRTPEQEKMKRQAPKRRYDDDPRHMEKKSTRHGGRWSPGYNDYEARDNHKAIRSSSKYQSNGGGGSNKSPGIGFSKFTWKKSDKKDSIDNDKKDTPPPSRPTSKSSNDIDKTKTASKFSAKVATPPPNIVTTGSKLVKRSSMGSKVGTQAPSVQVKSSFKSQTKVSTPKTSTPPMTAVLAASSRPLSTTSRPLGIMKQGAVIRKSTESPKPAPPPEPEAPKVMEPKEEPPPPGTEDVFEAGGDDGDISDASGISMELASDED